ncbi:cytochrome p450 [Hirsutella rhossiliensis]|uniref:Cytochrome p450 domain-containing protein n=1 Tax=Hirsutella rhossiliensis TaxID=111463 RepID=A0A9P8SJA3_9HYPO|nr:cytochrome p450 domain-containing protein [Hirsutella rhossiliensis]KAH0965088.1 cytochrome p450 domain-containing protein [Hirsutella rhossiliensis]
MEVLSQLSWQHVAGTIVVYLASLAFYRLFLHPLAKFPGPRLAAVSRWYEAYYDVVCNGKYTFKIEEMHKKYGPIIRISPFELHVSAPAFFEKLYNHDGPWNKYAWAYDAFSAKPSTICTIEHDVHRQRRAPLSAFFSKANVAAKQEIIRRRTAQLCGRIAEFAGDRTAAVNLGTAMSAFARDVAIEFILGKRYNNLESKDFSAAFTNVLQGAGAVWRITKHVRWFGPFMKSLPPSLVAKLGDEGPKGFFAFLKDTMTLTRDTISSSTRSAVSASEKLAAPAPANPPPPDEEKSGARINDEVGTVSGAAFETTAQSLRLIVYYVYSDPDILSRLRAELRSATDDGAGSLSLAALEKLPYLTAVLMEGLRLSPGLATRTARVAPNRELVYGQWRIPAGTPVGMTTMLMHRDEQLYPEPKRFSPDRWVDMEVRRKAHKTYAPFARGTRICLGMHLAWAELYMVVASLVQRFDFEFDGAGPKDVEPVSDQFTIGTEDQSGIKAFVTLYNG